MHTHGSRINTAHLNKEHTVTDVSRRQFLRNASIGAAAAGVLAVGGPGIVTAIETANGAPAALPADEETTALEGSDVFARVVDAKAGHIKIFAGTKAVDYTDQALAQKLLRATQ
jgi:hypothetical protein